MINLMKKILNDKLYFLYLSLTSCIYTVYMSHPFNLDDFYLHTTIGKWIIDNEEIPRTGILSWYAEDNNLPWIAHEWCSEILSYIIYKILNFNILYIEIFCMILLFLTIFIIIQINKKYIIKYYWHSFIFIILITISLYSVYVFRPQIISFSLFFIELYLLLQFYNNNNKYKNYIYIIPILAIIWANFHGGSSCLAYFLPLGLFTFCIIPFEHIVSTKYLNINDKFFRINLPRIELYKLLFISILAILSQSINPYGFNMIYYPYSNMGDTLMLNLINEWFPLNITDTGHLFIGFTIIFYVIYILLTTKRKIDFIDIAFLIVFLIMTFKSIRFIAYFDIMSCLCLFKYMYSKEIHTFINKKDFINKNIKLTIFIFIILTMVSFSYYNQNKFMLNEDAFTTNKEMMVAIKNENPKRLFNARALGNEIMSMNIKPFIDGRADIYTRTIYKDAISIYTLSDNPEKYFHKYKFDYILITNHDEIQWFLNHNKEKYKLILNDDVYSFYKIIK